MSRLAVTALGLVLVVSALASVLALGVIVYSHPGAPTPSIADGIDPPPPPEPTCHPCDPTPGGMEPSFTALAMRSRLGPNPLTAHSLIGRA